MLRLPSAVNFPTCSTSEVNQLQTNCMIFFDVTPVTSFNKIEVESFLTCYHYESVNVMYFISRGA